jgi:hypothetical protein
MQNLRLIIIPGILLSLISCNSTRPGKKPEKVAEKFKKEVIVPSFNADSALTFVKAQTDFGPRIPGSEAHAHCAEWLEMTLRRFTSHVQLQDFKARVHDGKVFNGKNIIATFKPESRARVLLCAHWDSRPYADHDPDPAKRQLPIDGANDGASGVGVILEIVRLLNIQPPDIGVDIIFFDLEDYGPPHDDQKQGKNEHWGLGSQYWSKNPHVPNYRARYAILLDMVGAPDAVFRQEGFSLYFAPDMVRKVWKIAHSLGYQEYFPDEKGGYINDDHYFINDIRNIPAIDIIHLDPNSSNGSFFEYWHTTGDTFEKIDKGMLEIVGRVVAEVVYRE